MRTKTLLFMALCLFYMITAQAQNTESMLSLQERQIAAISGSAAKGDKDGLAVALTAGLDAGLTVNEIKEVLVQLYAYAGFPRSMGALVTLMEVLEQRKAQGMEDAEGALAASQEVSRGVDYGAANQRKLFGRDARGAVLAFAPALDQFLKAHLFGDIFGRDNLDWKTRELATIASLAAMDGVENELKTHIAHGKHNGLTDAQIDEAITLVRSSEWKPEPPKTFAADSRVTVRKVFYLNRYNIRICADLYMPVCMDETVKHPAIIVGHPYGAVKEQCAGLYAQEMAARGFVTLAFDASYQGESSGMPRHAVSPDALVEDFSASVDWLGIQPFVDRERIGVIGICGSGGFSVCAASIDPRIKALVTVSMYDMGRATRNGLGDSMTDEQRKAMFAEVAAQRWREAEGAEARIRFGTPEQLPENANAVQREFFDYYRNPQRGQHPRYLGTRFTSQAALTNFYPFAQIKEISPRPVLFIAGENAHSRYFSEDAYKQANEPKELYIVPSANHVDLYDQTDKIPFDKLTEFFSEHLR
ncbi:MAG: carboxymuconolactone decarboxylase family protein [Paludibacteraceae bacterium]